MNETPPPGRRVLVGAGSYADAVTAMRIIAWLPDFFSAGLGGVLVEDPDMLAICQIPDQRIVLLSGTTTLAPDSSKVRAQLKSDARAFQRSLADTADPRGTGWAFEQHKGDLISTTLRVAEGWDVLILGYRQLHRVPGKVVLLQKTGAANDEMDEASRRLCQHLSAGRIAFSIKTNVEEADYPISPDTVQFDTLDECVRALTRTNAHAVLVDLKRGPIRNQTELSRLLEAARCPVIVFGSANTQSLLEHSTQIPPRPTQVGHENDS